jgi:hypothetical protein
VDANEPIGGKDMMKFQANTTLVSLMAAYNTNITTYGRGTKIINHIFGSSTILHQVDRCGYLPFYQGAWTSDHWGLYIYILGIHTPTHVDDTIARRRLSSKNKKAVIAFLSNINRDICSQMLTDLRSLTAEETWTGSHHEQLEIIDQHFTSILLTAETKLMQHYDTPWSLALNDLCQIKKYWSIANSCKVKNIQHPAILQTIHDNQGQKLYQGNVTRSTYSQQKKTKKETQKISGRYKISNRSSNYLPR